jgi:DNA processing protein
MHESEILTLQSIKGIGPVTIIKLIDELNDSNKTKLLDLVFNDTETISNLSSHKKIIEFYPNKELLNEAINHANKEIKSLEIKGIKVVAITSELYPKSLKLIKSPPTLLFCKGNIELFSQNRNVAVVGTRNNTPLGKAIAAKTTSFLVSSGFVIVSGLALGIDAIAHEECLMCKGNTIAVLVDVENVQPSKNRQLADNILSHGGLLISENKPGITISPPLFIKRDRIQTGLSLAVFPIETSTNGGTMHAVNAAKQENRLIYVPDHTKSGYQDKDIEQISGIISISNDSEVEPYTKSSYLNILEKLHKKELELISEKKVQGTLL